MFNRPGEGRKNGAAEKSRGTRVGRELSRRRRLRKKIIDSETTGEFGTSPRIILDGAHNTQAAKSVRCHIAKFLSSEKVLLIYGSLRDKDITGIMSNLAGLAREVILTQPKSERGATPQEILELI